MSIRITESAHFSMDLINGVYRLSAGSTSFTSISTVVNLGKDETELHLAHVLALLPLYPNTLVARKAMRPQAI